MNACPCDKYRYLMYSNVLSLFQKEQRKREYVQRF